MGIKKFLPIVVAALLAVALVFPAAVMAAGASATRTLPASVASGADFDVGIVASDCGAFGQVVETLPTGFSYVGTDSTDVIVTPVGNTVKFTFMGNSVSFDYTVTASTTAGTYSFSGVVKDADKIEYDIGGNTAITVSAPEGASATRTLPASVAPGVDFDVGIVASGCGAFGQVVETLPSDFSYVSCASTDVIVTPDGSTVKFTFIGDSVTFDYTVTASTTEGTYSFSGVVKDEDKNEYIIGGDTDLEVVLVTDTTPPTIEHAWLGYPVGAESARPGDPFVVAAVVTDDTGVTSVEVGTPFGTFPLVAQGDGGAAIWSTGIPVPGDTMFRTYELTLRAEDAAGNEATQPLELKVVPALEAYNVWLADGWNLISLPLIPDVADTGTVLDGLSFFGEDMVRAVWGDEAADSMMSDINTIWYYDAAGDWLYFQPATGLGNLAEIEDGKGYWVEVVSTVDEVPQPMLTVYGVEMQSGPQVLPPRYLVVEGWNLIGFKETRGMPVSQYLSAVEGKYARIYGYDAYNQYFYLVGPGGRNDMEPGAGYWIYMTDGGYIVP